MGIELLEDLDWDREALWVQPLELLRLIEADDHQARLAGQFGDEIALPLDQLHGVVVDAPLAAHGRRTTRATSRRRKAQLEPRLGKLQEST